MARRLRDSVAPLRRSSAGCMPARLGRLSAGVGRRHPVTVLKASLMTESMRSVWAQRHQAGAQYFALWCTKVRWLFAKLLLQHPSLNQLSNLSNAMCDVSFLRSDWRCRQYLIVLSNVTLRYLGLEQRCRVSFPWLTFSSRFPSMFLRWKTADTVFAALSFNFQLLTCGCRVFVSILPLPFSIHHHARLLGRRCMHTFLEMLVGKSKM